KGLTTQRKKSYENIRRSNLQSWACECRIRRTRRTKQTTEEKAAASGAARASARDGTPDGGGRGPQETINGRVSGPEEPNFDGRLSGAEGEKRTSFNGSPPGQKGTYADG